MAHGFEKIGGRPINRTFALKPVPHILIVTSEFPPLPGGIGAHAHQLAHQLSKGAYNVTVLTDQRAADGAEEAVFDQQLGFYVRRVPLHRMRMLMYFKRLLMLATAIKKADVIIASGKFSLWSVALFSLFHSKPILAVIHGTEVNFKTALLKNSIDMALQRFRHIIAVSHYTKSLISHLNHQNVVVIPNGYDSEAWDTDVLPSPNLQSIRLITVGNVTERKGQQNVIRHLPELIADFPQLQYHCVGIPTQKADFLQLAKTLKVDTHVTFHGRVSQTELKELLENSAICVMLSSPTATGDVEGFGIAILEANALGLPAIGSTNCGLEDAISNYQSGILVPYNDSQTFVEAVQTIVSNYESYRTQARQWASLHRWDVIINRYKAIIDSCD